MFSPLFIKPDLSPQERQRPLKERWSLVQTGIPCHDIKIRGPHLYVKGKLFCHFNESQVMYSSGPSGLLPIPGSLPQPALSTKDNTTMPPNENESLSPVPTNSIAVCPSHQLKPPQIRIHLVLHQLQCVTYLSTIPISKSFTIACIRQSCYTF